MRFTRILLISLVLAATAIAASAQTDNPAQQSPQTANTPDVAANPENVPLKVFAPDVVMFGQPQADFNQHMQPVLFDLNVYEHPVNEDAINADAQYLKEHPSEKFWLNGYADVRGDILYNMTLSQRRVDTVKNALLQRGIPQDRILVDVGWGKLYPTCADMTEDCLQKNRRVHFVYVP